VTVCLPNVMQNCLYCHIFYKKVDPILYYISRLIIYLLHMQNNNLVQTYTLLKSTTFGEFTNIMCFVCIFCMCVCVCLSERERDLQLMKTERVCLKVMVLENTSKIIQCRCILWPRLLVIPVGSFVPTLRFAEIIGSVTSHLQSLCEVHW
jgi:hypothetical protein